MLVRLGLPLSARSAHGGLFRQQAYVLSLGEALAYELRRTGSA